jgi:polyferredoxin
VAYLLIAVFTLIPYMRVAGRPLVLLDVAHREFIIFGARFLPTDTLLLALLMIAVFVTVFLLTALFGRVWCGWACPQTVYMEFVFRPIERLFEGEPGRRRPLLGDAAIGRGLKYGAYLAISMFLAHTFLAYFVGVDELLRWVRRSPLNHPASFLVMAAVTGLMLFDFGFFREQLCIVACPYGRLQSVMLDRQSLIVGYDRARGEPRGKLRKPAAGADRKRCRGVCNGAGHDDDRVAAGGSTGVIPGGRLALPFLEVEPQTAPGESAPAPGGPGKGDCIDCRMCVQTCPTGIDIREGLQMECIHCAQCIDACDAVMDRIGRARGLIRYTSQSRLEGERRRRVRPRVVLYPAVLAVVLSVLVGAVAARGPADVMIVRGPGLPFNELPGGYISNQVRLKIANRTRGDRAYRLELGGGIAGARLVVDENPMPVMAGGQRSEPGLIVAPRAAFAGHGHGEVDVVISDDAGFRKVVRFRLLGPWGAAEPDREPAGRHGGREGDEHD